MSSTKTTLGVLLVLIALGVIFLKACSLGHGIERPRPADSPASLGASAESGASSSAEPNRLSSGNDGERDELMMSGTSPAPEDAPQSADLSIIDQENPDQVADLFARTVATIDARTDSSTSDALMRARSLMSAELAAIYESEIPSGGVALMADLAEHDGYTLVSISPVLDGQPGDTPTTAMRGRSVTRTPLGRDGWSGEAKTLVYFLTMTFEDGAWRVSQMSVG